MKKIIRLTESDLIKIVNKVLNEQQEQKDCFEGVQFNVPPACMNSSNQTSNMMCLAKLQTMEQQAVTGYIKVTPEVKGQITRAVQCVKSKVKGDMN